MQKSGTDLIYYNNTVTINKYKISEYKSQFNCYKSFGDGVGRWEACLSFGNGSKTCLPPALKNGGSKGREPVPPSLVVTNNHINLFARYLFQKRRWKERFRLHVVLANAHGVWSAREGCLTGRWMVLAMFSVLSGAGSPWQCEIRLYVQLLGDQEQYLWRRYTTHTRFF